MSGRSLAWVVAVTALGAVLGAGLWLGMQRRPAGSLLEAPASAFTVEDAPPGLLVKFDSAQIALRALRWIPPRQEGVLVVQAVTQSDRQLVTVFRPGAAPAEYPVPRPQGVAEGFWRFAALQDAFLAPDGALLMLFLPGDPGSAELALAMVAESGALEARWVHRGSYDRMAVALEADPAVFLYGGKGPVQRLPLAGAARRPVAKSIELPPEVPEVADLVPTRAGSFLAASRNGLSAYQGAQGWSHFPLPGNPGVPCTGSRPVLVRAGRRFWWQPCPGGLVQVGPDGATVADREPAFDPEDPLARDAHLLRLLGADAGGRLWFALATPAPEAEPKEDWATYADAGLDRIYRWNPDREALERLRWSEALAALKPPVATSAGLPALRPEGGRMLLDGARAGWWLPLAALPFQALPPVQAR